MTNESSDLNFYASLTDDKTSLTVCLTFAISVSIVVPIFLYGIIWYDRCGTDNKRTLLNKFTSLACWAGIEYLVFVQTSENVRYLFGPLPTKFCFFARIIRSVIFTEMLLFVDLIVLSKYFYIFWIKNPAGFDDGFWASFLNLSVKLSSILSMTTWHFVMENQESRK